MARTLKAQVRGGRLVLDEPTEIPEGSEVDLVLADTELTGRPHSETEEQRDAVRRFAAAWAARTGGLVTSS